MPPPLLILPCSFIINIFLSLSLFFLIPIHVTSDGESYKSCAPFSCGKFTNISYPFWSINNQPSYCGHPNFKLDCEHGNLTIEINSQKFHIIDINQTSQLLRIAKLDLWSYVGATIPSCPNKYINVNLDLNFFNYTNNYEKYMLLYECGPLPDPYFSPLSLEVSQVISCLKEGKLHEAYIVSSAKVDDFIVLGCKNNITIPGLIEDSDSAVDVLDNGFEVGWSGVEEDVCDGCIESGGRCGYNANEIAILCLCPNQQSYGACGFCRANSTTKNLSNKPDCKRSQLSTSVILPPLAAPSNGQKPPIEQTPLNGLTPSLGPNAKESRDDSDQRGTMEYVAPEVWNRHFGGVSHKSDVYSYGTMLLEMVGGRKNINADASHTSEIYFPHWVYNRLEIGSDLRPDGVMDTEEDEIARRMIIVGLWCIQTFPNDRPTMSKVIEMLEVSMNSLKIPPKPLLSSPTRSVSESYRS